MDKASSMPLSKWNFFFPSEENKVEKENIAFKMPYLYKFSLFVVVFCQLRGQECSSPLLSNKERETTGTINVCSAYSYIYCYIINYYVNNYIAKKSHHLMFGGWAIKCICRLWTNSTYITVNTYISHCYSITHSVVTEIPWWLNNSYR